MVRVIRNGKRTYPRAGRLRELAIIAGMICGWRRNNAPSPLERIGKYLPSCLDEPSRRFGMYLARRKLERDLNFQEVPGSHTRLSPVVGSRAHELALVRNALAENPVLEEFERQLYQAQNWHILRYDQKAEIDALAGHLFASYINKYGNCGLTPDNAVAFRESKDPNAHYCGDVIPYDAEHIQNTWRVYAIVYPHPNPGAAYDYGRYQPVDIIKFHEFMHVEERTKEVPDHRCSPGIEIMTMLKSVMLLDEIHKKVNGIALNGVVDYGRFIRIGDVVQPLGCVTNVYRLLEKEHGSLGAAVTCPESLHYLKLGAFRDTAFSMRGDSMAAFQQRPVQLVPCAG